jgi:hypothetical protein
VASPAAEAAALGAGSVVDGCYCELNTLAKVNHDHLKPLLSQLVGQTFFKYFKLNLYQVRTCAQPCTHCSVASVHSPDVHTHTHTHTHTKCEQDCPFWVQEMLCGMQGGCSVCECDENEIPLPWKVPATAKVSSLRSNQFSQRWEEEDDDQSKVPPSRHAVHLVPCPCVCTHQSSARQKREIDLLPWIWSDPLEEQYMSYVNLVDNPEANTGAVSLSLSRLLRPLLSCIALLVGVLTDRFRVVEGYTDGASSIWKAIYEENCFKPITQTNSSHIDILDGTRTARCATVRWVLSVWNVALTLLVCVIRHQACASRSESSIG